LIKNKNQEERQCPVQAPDCLDAFVSPEFLAIGLKKILNAEHRYYSIVMFKSKNSTSIINDYEKQ
jgi:hypothetical protein